jgi:hypothetical protein
MLRAVTQSAAAGFAHMLGEAAGLHHGDDLIFAVEIGQKNRCDE